MKELREFLESAELVQYYDSLRTQLHLTTVTQLRSVDDDELAKLGMTKPEVRRLRQLFKKECPQSALGRLKKVPQQLSIGLLLSTDRSSLCLVWTRVFQKF